MTYAHQFAFGLGHYNLIIQNVTFKFLVDWYQINERDYNYIDITLESRNLLIIVMDPIDNIVLLFVASIGPYNNKYSLSYYSWKKLVSIDVTVILAIFNMSFWI